MLDRIFPVLTGLALVSCEPPGMPPPRVEAHPEWQVVGSEPVLPAGSLRKQALWNDPSVLRIADRYVMYATTSTEAPFEPPILPFRAVSKDGINWTLDPAGPLLSPRGGPYVSIETPSVVQFGGRWHMFFTGIYPSPDPAPMAIGHAVSDDGIKFTVQEWELLTASGSDWRSYLVGEPGAVVHDGRLIVYFSAVGARVGGGPPLQSIGLLTSPDGQSFTPPERAFGQGPAYPAAKGFAGYSAPAAVSHKGAVHLFYSVAHWQEGGDPEWKQVAIHHATSRTGTSNFAEDSRPVLNRESASWAGGEILAPSVMIDGQTVKLWFGGHVPNADLAPLINRNISGPEFGIGLAEAPLSVLEQ